MGHLLNFLEHLAIVLWMGSVVFFRFLAAPAVFHTLDPEASSRLMRVIFPRYYLLGLCASVVLALVQLGRGLLWYWGGMVLPSLILFSLLAFGMLYARVRDAGRSLLWNGVTLLLLFLYLIWMSTRGF